MHKLDTITEHLSSEVRTLGINLLVRKVPHYGLRYLERVINLPIQDVLRRSQSLFIHIPKNGGTTVTNALYGRFIGHRSAEWYRSADPIFFESKFKFAIIRNPAERFISAFYFLKSGGTLLVPASPRATRLVSKYKSVIDFIDCIEAGRVGEFKGIDLVFHEQTNYVRDKCGLVIVENLYKFDDIVNKSLKVPGAVIDMTIVKNSSKKPIISENDYLTVSDFVRRQYASDCKMFASSCKPFCEAYRPLLRLA
jgi:Sulfotransferase family